MSGEVCKEAKWANGQTKWKGTFKDGKRNGTWTQWRENGEKRQECRYKDGKLDGLETFWYGEGWKRQTNWKNGKK